MPYAMGDSDEGGLACKLHVIFIYKLQHTHIYIYNNNSNPLEN